MDEEQKNCNTKLTKIHEVSHEKTQRSLWPQPKMNREYRTQNAEIRINNRRGWKAEGEGGRERKSDIVQPSRLCLYSTFRQYILKSLIATPLFFE
jgi:hypothetical protein